MYAVSLRVEGSVLVTSRRGRLKETEMHATLGLQPNGQLAGKWGRREEEEAKNRMVTGMLEGSYGTKVARWLLTQLHTRKLAVDPETAVSYARKSKLRTRKDAPLVDAWLGQGCVQDLQCYTDLHRVYVDFENNGRLRRVVRTDGPLKADSDPVVLVNGNRLRRRDLFHCIITSCEMS